MNYSLLEVATVCFKMPYGGNARRSPSTALASTSGTLPTRTTANVSTVTTENIMTNACTTSVQTTALTPPCARHWQDSVFANAHRISREYTRNLSHQHRVRHTDDDHKGIDHVNVEARHLGECDRWQKGCDRQKHQHVQ